MRSVTVLLLVALLSVGVPARALAGDEPQQRSGKQTTAASEVDVTLLLGLDELTPMDTERMLNAAVVVPAIADPAKLSVVAKVEVAKAEDFSALRGIAAAVDPMSEDQAKEIRGEWWLPVMAGISLAAIAYIHWKLVTGRPLTGSEQALWNAIR